MGFERCSDVVKFEKGVGLCYYSIKFTLRLYELATDIDSVFHGN